MAAFCALFGTALLLPDPTKFGGTFSKVLEGCFNPFHVPSRSPWSGKWQYFYLIFLSSENLLVQGKDKFFPPSKQNGWCNPPDKTRCIVFSLDLSKGTIRVQRLEMVPEEGKKAWKQEEQFFLRGRTCSLFLQHQQIVRGFNWLHFPKYMHILATFYNNKWNYMQQVDFFLKCLQIYKEPKMCMQLSAKFMTSQFILFGNEPIDSLSI